jgi:carbon storage regulator CsrA
VGEVEIEIIEISRSRVKLGVRAPHHIPVIRKETLKIAQDNLLASDLIVSRGNEVAGEILKMLRHAESDLAGPEDVQPALPLNQLNAAHGQISPKPAQLSNEAADK